MGFPYVGGLPDLDSRPAVVRRLGNPGGEGGLAMKDAHTPESRASCASLDMHGLGFRGLGFRV